jgi:hypothetical protein
MFKNQEEDNNSENNYQSHRPLNILMKSKREPRFTSSDGNEQSSFNKK